MKFYRIGMELILMALIFGCATLSQDQCRMGDWYGIGYSDGSGGYAQNRLEEHQKACAEYGVMPNTNEYRRGWEQGIVRYCVPSNGYMVGRQGKSYYGVCTGPNADAFLRNYQIGQREYEVEKRLAEIGKKIEELDKQLVRTDISRQERETLKLRRRDLESERNILLIEVSSKNAVSPGGQRW